MRNLKLRHIHLICKIKSHKCPLHINAKGWQVVINIISIVREHCNEWFQKRKYTPNS